VAIRSAIRAEDADAELEEILGDEPRLDGFALRCPDRARRARDLLELTTGWETPQRRRCECGGADCDAVIYMTWEEQDRADHTPRRWAIASGHTPRGGVRWRVIEETDRFVIVEVDEEEIPMI
jgi:hypothetical protein